MARASFGTQAGYAYAEILEWIQSGRLRPCQRILTQRVAEELGMSRIPVRDALRLLASDRLVVGGDGRPWAVSSFSYRELEGAYVMREALETHSARLCALRATAQDVERLRGIARRLDVHIPKSDIPEDLDLEKSFHVGIAEITGCTELTEEIERWLLVIAIAVALRGIPMEEAHLHTEILEAIGKGDPELAAKAMSDHIRASLTSCQRHSWEDGHGR